MDKTKKPPYLQVAVTEELREKIERMAHENRRTMAREGELLLEFAVRAKEEGRKG